MDRGDARSAEPSVADRVTLTGEVYALPEQAEPLQAIEELGGVVSGAVIVISCELVGSTLPALSQARYLTVVVAETVKGAL